MSTPMGGPALLWIALLLFPPGGMSAATWKSVLSLNPPWNRIFRGENVTLTCNGKNSHEVSSTKWTHNGTLLIARTSSLDIINARVNNSGEYRCQNQNHIPSRPVHLEVFSDWLLTQSSADVVQEGESFFISCHGWMNWKVYKVTYYKNGIGLKYWYENHNLSITNATVGDSGAYHCEGRLRQIKYASDPFHIIVKKDSITSHLSTYYWLQFLIPVLVVILFAVDTRLFISTREQFSFLMKMKRTRKGHKAMDPSPKPDPQED